MITEIEWSIMGKIPFKPNRTRHQWNQAMKRKIIRHGFIPIQATYDKAGNCTICYEAGECPGYHIQLETEGLNHE